MKEETENLKTYQFIEDFSLFIKQCYCVIVWSVEKNTESKNSEVVRTKNGRIMLISNCVAHDSTKSQNSKISKSFSNSKKLVDY